MAPPYVFTSRDKKSRRDVQAGIILFAGSDASGTPVGIRTPNLLIRSQMLYPLSYGRTSRRTETSVRDGLGAMEIGLRARAVLVT